jgi:lipid-binding SYLF domain-containing protein
MEGRYIFSLSSNVTATFQFRVFETWQCSAAQAPNADAVCAQELIERTNSISVSAETFKIGYISGNRKEDGQPDFKLPGLRIR